MGDDTAPQQEYDRQRPAPPGMDHEDVVLDVPTLHVDSLDLDLSNLRARVSLNAEVLSLLRLSVGVDVDLGQARLDLRGVDAQALLKVRLENVASIIDRVVQTVDSHPEIIEPMVRTVQETLRRTGNQAGHALGQIYPGTAAPFGVPGERGRPTTEQPGQETLQAVQNASRNATQAVHEAGQDTTQAVREAGHAAAQKTGEARQGADRESGRPDIEARAAVDAERERRPLDGGRGHQNGVTKRLYRGVRGRIHRLSD